MVDVQVTGPPQKLIEWALTAPHVKIAEERKAGARLVIDSCDADVIAGVLRRMVSEGVPVIEFHREVRNLEDAFIDILGKLESGAGVLSGDRTGSTGKQALTARRREAPPP